MKVHEYQAKEIFSSYEIPVERHTLCRTADDAVNAFRSMNADRVAIKAQVPVGGRGKAGGIKLAENVDEVRRHANEILSMTIKGFPVTKILLSEAVQIASEYYLGFTIDRDTRSVVLIVSASGGVDIEEVAKQTPEKIFRYYIEPFVGIPDYLARKIGYTVFDKPVLAGRLAKIIQSLYSVVIDKDATLAEINPLVLTGKGTLIAIDAKMMFDDNALYRHPEIQALFEPSDDEKLELQAKERGFSYVRMDGDIGCMVNGAGLAMTTMDMIKLYGGNPANFLDIGGSSDPVKVIEAMKFLLDDKNVKVALVNIFGGITRCDDIAIGLIQAFDQIDSDIPVIVRLTGTNEHIGRGLLRGSSRFQVAETMSEAVHMSLESLKIERRS